MFKQVILVSTGGSEGRSKSRWIPTESRLRTSTVVNIEVTHWLSKSKTFAVGNRQNRSMGGFSQSLRSAAQSVVAAFVTLGRSAVIPNLTQQSVSCSIAHVAKHKQSTRILINPLLPFYMLIYFLILPPLRDIVCLVITINATDPLGGKACLAFCSQLPA